jgi:murein DD-endopeptidase MepM/ murein hydrolase activator NlpD
MRCTRAGRDEEVVRVRGRTLAVRTTLGLVAVAGAGRAQAALPTPGPWVWPLAGQQAVGRPFSPPATAYGPGHRGADLRGVPGQSVRAAGAGRIGYAGLLAGRGVVVVVHGDLRTTYEPVTAAVRVGQPVAAGQVIGRLDAGHPGCTPACLHWGLLRGDTYLDPVRLVRRAPSRLLPVDGSLAAASGARASGRLSPARAAAPADPAGTTSPSAPRPASEPRFALRGADAASAGGAVAALLAGLVLLRRPPRPPDGPATPAVARQCLRSDPPPALVEPRTAGLVDLASERHRRRPEVA